MRELANYNGAIFEKENNFKDILEDNSLFKFAEKHQFRKWIKNNFNVDVLDVWTKNILPDEAIYNPQLKTMFIIEKKYQSCQGSVDEKLQTCAFKKRQFDKIGKIIGIKFEYIYCLNNWFEDKKYNDVKDFIEESGCKWFYNYNFPLNCFYEGF